MRESSNSVRAELLIAIIFGAVICITATSLCWYKAAVQAEVYQRQGTNISTWEVLMGAKPIERIITIKQ